MLGMMNVSVQLPHLDSEDGVQIAQINRSQPTAIGQSTGGGSAGYG
jgi:hypothetical protein